jgi:glycine cleavage system H protein
MSTMRYTKDHEWIRVDGGEATVGITHHAQERLGDVVYVELPEVGRKVEQGAQVAVVESVKAASEIFAPAAGEVTAVNQALESDHAKINQDAEGEGWFLKLRLADPSQIEGLMDEAAYRKFVEENA